MSPLYGSKFNKERCLKKTTCLLQRTTLKKYGFREESDQRQRKEDCALCTGSNREAVVVLICFGGSLHKRVSSVGIYEH